MASDLTVKPFDSGAVGDLETQQQSKEIKGEDKNVKLDKLEPSKGEGKTELEAIDNCSDHREGKKKSIQLDLYFNNFNDD